MMTMKQITELMRCSGSTAKTQLSGFDKWWHEIGKNLTGDRAFLAKSAWDYAQSLKQDTAA